MSFYGCPYSRVGAQGETGGGLLSVVDVLSYLSRLLRGKRSHVNFASPAVNRVMGDFMFGLCP